MRVRTGATTPDELPVSVRSLAAPPPYVPAVLSYRLVMDGLMTLAVFTAPDDATATTTARALAPQRRHADFRRFFSVERQHGQAWLQVAAWMTRPARQPALV